MKTNAYKIPKYDIISPYHITRCLKACNKYNKLLIIH